MASNVLKSFIFLDYNQIGLEDINSSFLCFYILFICFSFETRAHLPGTCYVGQTGLKLVSLLVLSPESLDYRCTPASLV